MSKMPSAVALGFFDGVHIAHRKIIERATAYAKSNNLRPVALSFDRSPLELLSDKNVCYLTDNRAKEEIITQLGAEAELLTLSCKLLSMEPEEFVKDILVNEYNIRYAVCGYNYRFGKGGSGDTELLKKLGGRYGFETEIMKEGF